MPRVSYSANQVTAITIIVSGCVCVILGICIALLKCCENPILITASPSSSSLVLWTYNDDDDPLERGIIVLCLFLGIGLLSLGLVMYLLMVPT